MAYADFTLDDVQRSFQLTVPARRPLFSGMKPVVPPEWLPETLRRGRHQTLVSEKARSELIVMPVLLACCELVNDQCSIWSGTTLNVDPERGLSGECDFILAGTPPTPNLQAPLLVILEAKKQDIEDGLAQCTAQMLGARVFNDQRQQPLPAVFGCVTTGELWQFLRLRDRTIDVDSERYFIKEIDLILGILLAILKSPVPSQQASDAA